MWSDSSPRGTTWSYLDEAGMFENYYQQFSNTRNTAKLSESIRGLKLILLHNSHFQRTSLVNQSSMCPLCISSMTKFAYWYLLLLLVNQNILSFIFIKVFENIREKLDQYFKCIFVTPKYGNKMVFHNLGTTIIRDIV